MKFFIWLNGEPQSEIDRAVSVLNKQKMCSTRVVGPIDSCIHFSMGNFKKKWILFGKKWYDHYDIKFSKTGTEAMISKRGSVDFFFASKEEVDKLKEVISNRYK
jgi:hypothetical protein